MFYGPLLMQSVYGFQKPIICVSITPGSGGARNQGAVRLSPNTKLTPPGPPPPCDTDRYFAVPPPTYNDIGIFRTAKLYYMSYQRHSIYYWGNKMTEWNPCVHKYSIVWHNLIYLNIGNCSDILSPCL